MRNRKLFRRNLFLLLIAVMLFSASCGKNKATTMKLIKTDGEVGVENEKGKSVDLVDNLGLYSGYSIDTQTKSFAWIDLDDTKLTKMDEKSDVDIIKDGKKLELVVNSGGLFFNVTKPLEEDESMDIRTSTIICGIRGTCGWVESQGDISYVGLLDGKVECSVTVGGKEETVVINAKEILVVKEDGTYEVKGLTHKDVPEFVQAEVNDEPFGREILEQEEQAEVTDELERFLGRYIKDYGDSAYTLNLYISEEDRFLYISIEDGYHIMLGRFDEYSLNGNELKATDKAGTGTSTFFINDDGSVTATVSGYDFYNGVYERNDEYDIQ